MLVDGGMVSFLVKQVAGPDALCECVEGGILSSRANLTFRRGGRIIRGKNSQQCHRNRFNRTTRSQRRPKGQTNRGNGF